MEVIDHLQTDLSRFTAGNYKPGPKWKVWVWYFFNCLFFNTAIPWPYSLKRSLLRLFGADVGKGVVIKTRVVIKYPWRFAIGDYSWLGEASWIENFENVTIGRNVCVSQRAMLLTGNHDYTKSDFRFRFQKIKLEDGVWIGAHTVVCPGVVCRSHSILTVGSVATKELEPWCVYAGVPAQFVRCRNMTD